MTKETLKVEVHDELTSNILHFWESKMLDANGGFYGRMTGQNELLKDSARGGILNARILWTFSSAARVLKSSHYLDIARHTKEYIFNHFFDDEMGGTYWMLDGEGNPIDTKKQIYSQAFFIYALVEYYRVSNDEMSLEKAKELFYLIEKHSFDNNKNGYFEAYSRNWQLLDDLRLSEKDANEKKTMNTHLHVLEAYTNLYRVWKDDLLGKQLKNLIEIFLDRIINKETYHLDLFFDENWTCKSTQYSFGHDIEASWLLDEAAVVLGDNETLLKVRHEIIKIADASSNGLRDNGAMMNEFNCENGHLDTNSDWWPQAEAMVGFYNAYERTEDRLYLDKVFKSWNFISQNIIDKKYGEWVWSVTAVGDKNTIDDKAGFWKCPYHNGRMCLELIDRIN